MGTAALAGILYLTVWLGDLGGPLAVTSVFSTLLAQGLFGYKLRATRGRLAAWGLMGAYVLGIAMSVVNGTIWSGILVKAAIAYVYVRGFVAAIDYQDLTKQIRDAANAQAATDAT